MYVTRHFSLVGRVWVQVYSQDYICEMQFLNFALSGWKVGGGGGWEMGNGTWEGTLGPQGPHLNNNMGSYQVYVMIIVILQTHRLAQKL